MKDPLFEPYRWPNRGLFGRIGALFRIDSITVIADHRYVAQPATKQQPDYQDF